MNDCVAKILSLYASRVPSLPFPRILTLSQGCYISYSGRPLSRRACRPRSVFQEELSARLHPDDHYDRCASRRSCGRSARISERLLRHSQPRLGECRPLRRRRAPLRGGACQSVWRIPGHPGARQQLRPPPHPARLGPPPIRHLDVDSRRLDPDRSSVRGVVHAPRLQACPGNVCRRRHPQCPTASHLRRSDSRLPRCAPEQCLPGAEFSGPLWSSAPSRAPSFDDFTPIFVLPHTGVVGFSGSSCCPHVGDSRFSREPARFQHSFVRRVLSVRSLQAVRGANRLARPF